MKEIEFNLLTEPWIRVRLRDNTVREVSLTEALVSAQDYVDLAGEMPTQDAAVLRLLLGLDEVPKPDDTADALACAVCCANSIRMRAFEKAGSTTRTYATPRRGRSAAGARSAWTALFTKEGKTS